MCGQPAAATLKALFTANLTSANDQGELGLDEGKPAQLVAGAKCIVVRCNTEQQTNRLFLLAIAS